MYQRLSFLRNPRYAVPSGKEARALQATGLRGSSSAHRHCRGSAASSSAGKQPLHKSTTETAAGAGFTVTPAEGVLFDAYQPGGVYVQTVQLQNAGQVMQQLRLLPPSSRYFQVSFPRCVFVLVRHSNHSRGTQHDLSLLSKQKPLLVADGRPQHCIDCQHVCVCVWWMLAGSHSTAAP